MLQSTALSLAALALALPFSAQAQTAPPPTVIEGRAGLQQACPEAAEQLQDTLRHQVLRHGLQGRMEVRFTLRGNRISEVETRDGPQGYQPYVRLAVAGLECRSAGEQAQSHRFEINFVRA